MKILIVLLVLFACGKTTIPTDPDPSFPGVVVYNVPSEYYWKYKTQLDLVETDIVSLSGKHLVRFKPSDEDPKYTHTWTGYQNFSSTGEGWIYFKETKDQFTNVSDGAAAVAYVGSPSNPRGTIVMNFSISMSWTGHNFRQVLNHEILHNLGFSHTFDGDHSVMNYDYVYKTTGVTDLDTQRLADAFPFSLAVVTIKDLEKIGAAREGIDADKYAGYLVESYGLSESRAETVSRLMISKKKIRNLRSLTGREKDLLTNEILGFGYGIGKKALENYVAGEQDSLDDLIEVAADKNETTPEHVKELFGEIFL